MQNNTYTQQQRVDWLTEQTDAYLARSNQQTQQQIKQTQHTEQQQAVIDLVSSAINKGEFGCKTKAVKELMAAVLSVPVCVFGDSNDSSGTKIEHLRPGVVLSRRETSGRSFVVVFATASDAIAIETDGDMYDMGNWDWTLGGANHIIDIAKTRPHIVDALMQNANVQV